jgi:hypothetical protein
MTLPLERAAAGAATIRSRSWAGKRRIG